MGLKKQQVVFIGRKIWGGGAEKIMYYLSHSMDRNIFEPHVVYMLNQENALEKYDPSIPLYCLEDQEQFASVKSDPAPLSNHSRKLIGRVVNRAAPAFKKQMRERLNLWIARFQTYINPGPAYSPFIQEVLIGLGFISRSISTPLTYTYGLRYILSKLEQDAILVAMQEEPTIQAWLNSIYHNYPYLSYLCAPESIHIPLIYPERERREVEHWLFGNACRGAKMVTVPNTWMYNDMLENFGLLPDQVKIVPNPIDCKLVVQKSTECLPNESIYSGKTVFVQLARLDPQKNHRLMLDACEILRQKYQDFVVLVIGDGSERAAIEKTIEEKKLKDHVILLGELSNPYPYLKIARSSLMTSSFEASPLALVDSLLLGAVPISTDCIAGPSDTLENGACGILVPTNGAEQLAEAMLQIALNDDLHHQLKTAGMKHAWDFDMPQFVDTWSNMILANRKISLS